MATMTIAEALADALAHHQAGRLGEAEAIYRRVLAAEPRNGEALHLLGALAHQVGRNDVAAELIGQAIAAQPAVAQYYNTLGNVRHRLGQWEDAIAAYRRGLELAPDAPELHANLGAAWSEMGRLEEASAAYREAVRLRPDFAEAHANLGNVLRKQGRHGEALAACRRGLELRRELAVGHHNLGAVLGELGRWEEAASAFREAIRLNPRDAGARRNLGGALKELGRHTEAVAECEAALALAPDDPHTLNNLGTALDEIGRAEEAIAAFQRALALSPNLGETHSNLANVLKAQGELDEALRHFRIAVELSPADARLHSNLILTLLYHSATTERDLHEECARWEQRHGAPLRPFILPHLNPADPGRRLRVGYVSPDFCDHVVGRNVLPVLREHDRGEVEIFCYSGVREPDERTRQFRELAAHWRETRGKSDDAVAAGIRADRIDLLVDLSLHVAYNRLPIFARKPAPVQVSWAGYPGSTGLSAIDYRITDPFLEPCDPAGEAGGESPVRIESFWCYDPLGSVLEPGDLPAASTGRVTFGCLNNFCKVTPGVVQLWRRILERVEGSRLLVMTVKGSHRERFLRALDVNAARVTFVEPGPREQYLALYREVDVVLDPFPYNGHTTSLDALWMGVPVVTLVGNTVVSRAGLSQLSQLGLAELVTEAPEDYEQCAVSLAGDLPRLAEYRRTLRSRMQASVLMNAPRFARRLEQAYREMWRAWCAKQSASKPQ